MKLQIQIHYYVFFVILQLTTSKIQSQDTCRIQNILFNRQGQIDSFSINYPNCDHAEEMYIWGNNIRNLSGLKKLKTADFIEIWKTNITDLDGLDSLVRFGQIIIQNNDSLTSIRQLKNIRIGFNLGIYRNDKLLNYDGIQADTILFITFEENILCKSLEKIELKYCKGLRIFYPHLDSLSSHKIEILDQFTLDFTSTIKGIKSFNMKYFTINTSPEIKDISELDSLRNRVGISFQGIALKDNLGLSHCAIDIICSNLDNPDFHLNIRNNAIGCRNKEEIREQCITSVSEKETERESGVFPNPTTDYIFLKGYRNECRYVIHSVQGKIVDSGNASDRIDVSELPPGLYFMSLTEKGKELSRVFRFVKL